MSDLKLIGWSTQLGSPAATQVSFVGGQPLPYQLRSDGLYLTNVSYSFVPEPSVVTIVMTGLSLCMIKRQQRVSR